MNYLMSVVLTQCNLSFTLYVTGKRVLILNGQYKDTEAILEGIDEHKFSATLVLDSVRSHRMLS